MTPSKYKPEHHSSLIPAIAVTDAKAAIEWYKTVFNANELFRLCDGNGLIAHAEIKIDDSVLTIADEQPPYNMCPGTLGGSTVVLNLSVPDADVVFHRALQYGAETIFDLNDQFYGYRSGRIKDPFGYAWIISTMKEELSAEEMQKRFEKLSE